MSAEQGDVEVIREALQRYGHLLPTDAFNELRRSCHAVAAALERAEQELVDVERDRRFQQDRAQSAERRLTQLGVVIDWKERAEKAEHALAELESDHETVCEALSLKTLELHHAERALAAIIEEFRAGSSGYEEDDPVVILARAALRPSEEASE